MFETNRVPAPALVAAEQAAAGRSDREDVPAAAQRSASDAGGLALAPRDADAGRGQRRVLRAPVARLRSRERVSQLPRSRRLAEGAARRRGHGDAGDPFDRRACRPASASSCGCTSSARTARTSSTPACASTGRASSKATTTRSASPTSRSGACCTRSKTGRSRPPCSSPPIMAKSSWAAGATTATAWKKLRFASR